MILERVLILIAFGALAVALAFLFLIARFYEIKAREPVRARLFLGLAALLFAAGVALAFDSDGTQGNVISDTLMFLGGSGTIALEYFLLTVLTRRKT
ncbi:MAG: hypothetical protein HY327_13640 [Chloroflexi bacterium]|nr:hypothetical protein [Chloroflexota bacterium]